MIMRFKYSFFCLFKLQVSRIYIVKKYIYYASRFIKKNLNDSYMQRKTVLVSAGLILIGALTTTMLFLYFPYNPYNPPHLDDTGSTLEGIRQIVKANNQFALDLYMNITKNENGNKFFSPYSIFSALAMVYEGAAGLTREEIQSVFHLPLDDVLHPNFAALFNLINQKKSDYTLRTGNALWCQEEFPLNEEYINNVEAYYGGKVTNVDFINELEETRQLINNFIEKQTNDKIQDLIPQGAIDAMTRLVLTNAIYFQGEWKWKFDKSQTENNNFFITPNQSVNVPMMRMKSNYPEYNYADLEDIQIIELPYMGDQVSMIILLPEENNTSIEQTLTLEKLQNYEDQMEPTHLSNVIIPKFEFETKSHLSNLLSAMGMPTAFGESANFSKLTNSSKLYVDDVIHQAYVKVDEVGTEAAAATAVIMTLSLHSEIFLANHPFLFYIRENETGNILFLGKVQDPSQNT